MDNCGARGGAGAQPHFVFSSPTLRSVAVPTPVPMFGRQSDAHAPASDAAVALMLPPSTPIGHPSRSGATHARSKSRPPPLRLDEPAKRPQRQESDPTARSSGPTAWNPFKRAVRPPPGTLGAHYAQAAAGSKSQTNMFSGTQLPAFLRSPLSASSSPHSVVSWPGLASMRGLGLPGMARTASMGVPNPHAAAPGHPAASDVNGEQPASASAGAAGLGASMGVGARLALPRQWSLDSGAVGQSDEFPVPGLPAVQAATRSDSESAAIMLTGLQTVAISSPHPLAAAASVTAPGMSHLPATLPARSCGLSAPALASEPAAPGDPGEPSLPALPAAWAQAAHVVRSRVPGAAPTHQRAPSAPALLTALGSASFDGMPPPSAPGVAGTAASSTTEAGPAAPAHGELITVAATLGAPAPPARAALHLVSMAWHDMVGDAAMGTPVVPSSSGSIGPPPAPDRLPTRKRALSDHTAAFASPHTPLAAVPSLPSSNSPSGRPAKVRAGLMCRWRGEACWVCVFVCVEGGSRREAAPLVAIALLLTRRHCRHCSALAVGPRCPLTARAHPSRRPRRAVRRMARYSAAAVPLPAPSAALTADAAGTVLIACAASLLPPTSCAWHSRCAAQQPPCPPLPHCPREPAPCRQCRSPCKRLRRPRVLCCSCRPADYSATPQVRGRRAAVCALALADPPPRPPASLLSVPRPVAPRIMAAVGSPAGRPPPALCGAASVATPRCVAVLGGLLLPPASCTPSASLPEPCGNPRVALLHPGTNDWHDVGEARQLHSSLPPPATVAAGLAAAAGATSAVSAPEAAAGEAAAAEARWLAQQARAEPSFCGASALVSHAAAPGVLTFGGLCRRKAPVASDQTDVAATDCADDADGSAFVRLLAAAARGEQKQQAQPPQGPAYRRRSLLATEQWVVTDGLVVTHLHGAAQLHVTAANSGPGPLCAAASTCFVPPSAWAWPSVPPSAWPPSACASVAGESRSGSPVSSWLVVVGGFTGRRCSGAAHALDLASLRCAARLISHLAPPPTAHASPAAARRPVRPTLLRAQVA